MINKFKKDILSKIVKDGKYYGNLWRHPDNKSLKAEINDFEFGNFQTFNEKVFAILNDLEQRGMCPVCKDTPLVFINVSRGFTKTCSLKCSRNSEEWKQKVEQTSIENYGVKNVFQSQQIKDKIQTTIKQRYNVEFSSQSDIMQEKSTITKRQKYIDTHLTNHFQTMEERNIQPVDWNLNDYIDAAHEYKFIHLDCNTVFTGTFSSNGIPLCPICKSSGRSIIEQKLANELINKFSLNKISLNNRKLIAPKEIDIVIDNKLGIEVNGIYWHQDGNGKIPLLDKSNMSVIPILHFWDFELDNKFEICKSIICAKMGNFEEKIFARKCTIKTLSAKEAETFFNNNHLQGHTKAGYYLGLIYNNELVMALSIGKSRFNKNVDIELHRLASKLNTTIVGGVDKLFKQVKNDFKNNKLISYADKRYSNGDVYKRLGFTELKSTTPNYFWVNREIVLSRYQCQKHKLEKLLGTNNYNPNLSETDNMLNNGYIKIKDCGNKVFILNL